MEAEFLPSCSPLFAASATTMTSAPGCFVGTGQGLHLILSQLDQGRKGEAPRVPLPPTYLTISAGGSTNMCRFRTDMQIQVHIFKHNFSGTQWYLVLLFVHSPQLLYLFHHYLAEVRSLSLLPIIAFFLWPEQETHRLFCLPCCKCCPDVSSGTKLPSIT